MTRARREWNSLDLIILDLTYGGIAQLGSRIILTAAPVEITARDEVSFIEPASVSDALAKLENE